MPLYRPSELRAFLSQEGLTPLRSLSQSFLVDGNVLAKLADILHLSPGDPVLEIGPGPGVVTECLHQIGARLLTIEKDAAFARLITRFPKVISIHEDALKIDLPALILQHFQSQKRVHIVSNLPYRAASAFLRKLWSTGAWARSLTVMLPVAIFSKLSSSPPLHWLGIACAIFCRQISSFSVGKNSFYPKPQCNSVLVQWELATPLLEKEAEDFLKWLSISHSLKQRRYLGDLPGCENFCWESAQLHPKTPLVDLKPQMWLALWSHISRLHPDDLLR